VFAVQDEIASAIVGKLKGRLTAEPTLPIARRMPVTPDVYELYLKGRYCFARRYKGMLQPAADCFRRVMELDPDFAPAYAGYADALCLIGWYGIGPHQDVLGPAVRAAQRAVVLDDGLPEAHHSLAMVHFWLDWDWDIAEREFRKALALNPRLPLTHAYFGLALALTDRLDEAIREAEAGLVLDPLSPLQLYLSSVTCNVARRFERALAYAKKGLELEPDSIFGLFSMGLSLQELGRYPEAVDAQMRCVTLSGRMPYFLSFLGGALAGAGRRAEALDVLRELEERDRLEPAWFAPLVHAALGEFDAAFEGYQRAMAEGVRPTPLAMTFPALDPVRRDPRFADLLRSSGYTGTALLTRGTER
jgi:tetratricopeptide (TPR) repeat protein